MQQVQQQAFAAQQMQQQQTDAMQQMQQQLQVNFVQQLAALNLAPPALGAAIVNANIAADGNPAVFNAPAQQNLSKSQVANHSSALNKTKKTFSSGRKTGAISSSVQESTNSIMKKNAISMHMLTSIQIFPCPQRNGLTASKWLTLNLKMLITL